MTDKEFKRLNRAQLIEIIYQLQVKLDELSEENQCLTAELADKRLLISRAGNIAEAAFEMRKNPCRRTRRSGGHGCRCTKTAGSFGSKVTVYEE